MLAAFPGSRAAARGIVHLVVRPNSATPRTGPLTAMTTPTRRTSSSTPSSPESTAGSLTDSPRPEPEAAPPEPDGGPWDPSRRLLTIGLLLLVSATAFEALAVATIMPATAADLGGIGLYGWAFSAFLLANLVGIVTAGSISDLRGPLIPFVLGVVVLTIGLILGGIAPTMEVLILARVLQGFAGGCVSAVAYVAIGRGYPASARPQMLAWLSSAWVVPGLIGPAVAGLIADQIGWRWVFLALVPLPPLAAAMTVSSLRRIPAGHAVSRALVRVRYAAQLAVGAGLLLTGLGWQDQLIIEQPLSLPLTLHLPPVLVAVVLIVVGFVVALPSIWYLLPAGTLRAKAGLPAAIAAMTLLNLGFFGVDAFVPLALVDLRDQTILFASVALTGGTVAWTVGSWVQARYAVTGARRVLIQIGIAVLALGCGLFVPVLWPQVPVVAGIVAWTIAGLGMGLAYSTLSLVVLETAPSGQEGAAAASLQIASVLGSGIGTGVGGALVGSLGAAQNLMRPALTIQFLAMVGVLIVGLVAARRLPKGPPAVAAPAPASSVAEPRAA